MTNSQFSTYKPEEIEGTKKIWTTEQEEELKKEAKNKNLKAQAILQLGELYNEIKEKIEKQSEEAQEKLRKQNDEIQEDLVNYRKQLTDYKKDLKRTDSFLKIVTMAVAIAFITAFYLLSFDKIRDKDLYLNYSNLYENYSERNSQLKDMINEQKIEVNNLKNELEILKVKNSLK